MKTTLRLLALTLCLIFAATFMVACNKGTKQSDEPITLVGQWEYSALNCTYTFNDDGTGSYNFAGSEMKFTYEDKGDSFSVLYDGNTVASDYEYVIEGNVLTITDSFGSPVEYTRK